MRQFGDLLCRGAAAFWKGEPRYPPTLEVTPLRAEDWLAGWDMAAESKAFQVAVLGATIYEREGSDQFELES